MMLMEGMRDPWFWSVLLGLSIISWFYNRLTIDRMHNGEHLERWTWLTVVVGVAYTIAGVSLALRRLDFFLVSFLGFAFAGWPMIVGDIKRYWSKSGHLLEERYMERLCRTEPIKGKEERYGQQSKTEGGADPARE